MINILIVEDDENWCKYWEELLSLMGCKCYFANNWKDALDKLINKGADRLILDLHLGCGIEDGLFLLDLMSERDIYVPTMVVSYSADLQCTKINCYDYSFVSEVISKNRIVKVKESFKRFLDNKKGIKMEQVAKIFLIFGHNREQFKRIKKILYDMRTMPVYLEREADTGKTIIELVEKYTDASYAVALMTNDDCCYPTKTPDKTYFRARQNVIFEIGYIYARLGRGHLMFLKEDGVELPSDIAGIRYHLLSKSDTEIQIELSREFNKLGIPYEL